jgi:hypothetical protein
MQRYFSALGDYSLGLLDRLPIAAAIEPIEETFGRLKPALESRKPEELQRLVILARPAVSRPFDDRPAGMNTIGILADRLTILVCKAWYLLHRQGNAAAAAEVRELQMPDIARALAWAVPGHATLLEKVSSNRSDAVAGSFDEAYYGLLTANVLMWETQEMLYVKDMESVPAEDLRQYIRFFSQANMMRNAYIAQCETLYWRVGT